MDAVAATNGSANGAPNAPTVTGPLERDLWNNLRDSQVTPHSADSCSGGASHSEWPCSKEVGRSDGGMRSRRPAAGCGVRLTIMASKQMIVREATADDLSVFAAAAYEAMNWSGEARFTHEQIMGTPELLHYLEGWRRAGDFGVVAEAAAVPMGAA